MEPEIYSRREHDIKSMGKRKRRIPSISRQSRAASFDRFETVRRKYDLCLFTIQRDYDSFSIGQRNTISIHAFLPQLTKDIVRVQSSSVNKLIYNIPVTETCFIYVNNSQYFLYIYSVTVMLRISTVTGGKAGYHIRR